MTEKKQKVIVFEGVDGCGKSTLLAAVAKRLGSTWTQNDRRVRTLTSNVHTYAFPNANRPAGKLIRQIFADEERIASEAMMWLFMAEAADFVAKILPTMRDRVLLCDRFATWSGQVYQAPHQSWLTPSDSHFLLEGQDRVRAVAVETSLWVPDYVFVVDVPPCVALERRAARGLPQNRLYEPSTEAKIEEQRQLYLRTVRLDQAAATDDRLAHNVYVLDGTKSIDELVLRVFDLAGLHTFNLTDPDEVKRV